MQNSTIFPLPGADEEPDVQAAATDALAALASWCHAIELWIRAHLLLPKHAPNTPCTVCAAWKRRQPTFPHAPDELLARLQADDAVALIRSIHVFPQALRGCRRLCIWKAWADGGGKVLLVERDHVAALPGIGKGAMIPEPAPGSPTLVAFRNAAGQVRSMLCVDGHALDGVAVTKFDKEKSEYAFAADSTHRGPWTPRTLLLCLGCDPQDRQDVNAANATIENAIQALKRNRGEIALQQANSALGALKIGAGWAFLGGGPISKGWPPANADAPEAIHLATLAQLPSSPLKPGIQRLQGVDPGLDLMLRSGKVNLWPVPSRFQTPDGPRLFAVPAWTGLPKSA